MSLDKGYRLLEQRGFAERVHDGYQLTPGWFSTFVSYCREAQAQGLSFNKVAEMGCKNALLSKGEVTDENLEYMIEATLYLSRNNRARL